MELLMLDSERGTTSLSSCSIDLFCLSLTVFKLFDLFSLARISLPAAKFCGFWGNMTPKMINFRKTLA